MPIHIAFNISLHRFWHPLSEDKSYAIGSMSVIVFTATQINDIRQSGVIPNYNVLKADALEVCVHCTILCYHVLHCSSNMQAFKVKDYTLCNTK